MSYENKKGKVLNATRDSVFCSLYLLRLTLILVEDWNVDDVAQWARNELNFSEKNIGILLKQEIKGTSLVNMPTIEKLESTGLPVGPATDLWAAIQRLKTEQAVGMLYCNDFVILYNFC